MSTNPQTTIHADDIGVDRFAEMMKGKMASSRAKGRSGCMRDVACIAMMLHLNWERTSGR